MVMRPGYPTSLDRALLERSGAKWNILHFICVLVFLLPFPFFYNCAEAACPTSHSCETLCNFMTQQFMVCVWHSCECTTLFVSMLVRSKPTICWFQSQYSVPLWQFLYFRICIERALSRQSECLRQYTRFIDHLSNYHMPLSTKRVFRLGQEWRWLTLPNILQKEVDTGVPSVGASEFESHGFGYDRRKGWSFCPL